MEKIFSCSSNNQLYVLELIVFPLTLFVCHMYELVVCKTFEDKAFGTPLIRSSNSTILPLTNTVRQSIQ